MAVLVAALPKAEQLINSFADFFLLYPVLVLTVVVGGAVAGLRTFPPVAVAGLLIGLLAVIAAAVIPWGPLGIEGVDFEVTKTLHYWTPVFLAVMAAYALWAIWHRPGLRQWAKLLVAGVFLVGASLPLREEPIPTFHLGEHRMSETLSIDLRLAETGFWVGYPDPRNVVNAAQQELMDRLRDEVTAGLLESDHARSSTWPSTSSSGTPRPSACSAACSRPWSRRRPRSAATRRAVGSIPSPISNRCWRRIPVRGARAGGPAGGHPGPHPGGGLRADLRQRRRGDFCAVW